MSVRSSDLAASLAPSARGAPADVVAAIDALALALAEGTTPTLDQLRWPEPALRAPLLEVLAERDLAALRGAPAETLRDAMRAILDAIDSIDSIRERLLAGHRAAITQGHQLAEGVRADDVHAMWRPLAIASLRVSLAPWLSGAYGSVALRSAPRRADGRRWTLDRAAPAQVAAQELLRSVRVAPTALALLEKSSRGPLAAQLERGPSRATAAGPEAASPRQARIAERWAHVRQAAASAAARSAPMARRTGPLWIVLDRTRQPDPDEHARWRSAALLLASAGLVCGREVKFVLTDDALSVEAHARVELAAVFELRAEGTFEPLLSLLDRAVVRRPSDAMAWIRANVRGRLDAETDVAIVTSSRAAELSSGGTDDERVALSAAQRAAGVRLHLVRPGHDPEFPHPAVFDVFHFLAVEPIEA